MIAGVATETIVVSTRIMKNPITSENSAGHGLTSPGVGSPVVCGARGSFGHDDTQHPRGGQSIPAHP